MHQWACNSICIQSFLIQVKSKELDVENVQPPDKCDQTEMNCGLYPPSLKFSITYECEKDDTHKRRPHTVSVTGCGIEGNVSFRIIVFEPPTLPSGVLFCCHLNSGLKYHPYSTDWSIYVNCIIIYCVLTDNIMNLWYRTTCILVSPIQTLISIQEKLAAIAVYIAQLRSKVKVSRNCFCACHVCTCTCVASTAKTGSITYITLCKANTLKQFICIMSFHYSQVCVHALALDLCLYSICNL